MTATARRISLVTPTEPAQRTALIAGVWFILTFLFSIPALILYGPLLDHANYVLGAGADTRIELGALLEVMLVVANIATAVVLFPVLKRQSEPIALGYVALRIVESCLILIGVVSVLAVVTLRQDLAGSSGADGSLVNVGRALVAVKDQTFLLGPAFCAGLGNGLMLGYLMYRSGLVPRGLALIGLIGGPIVLASGVAVLLGAYGQSSLANRLFTAPEFVWELSLGIWLVVKGFRPSPILGPPRSAGGQDGRHAATGPSRRLR